MKQTTPLLTALVKLRGYRLRTCHSSHACELCDQSIKIGEEYRDGGYGRRAHETCLHRAFDKLREVAEG
jgi:hypothetical protein